MKRTQSRPNLLTKESVLPLNPAFNASDKKARLTTRIDAGDDILQRHNSCSLISNGPKDRNKSNADLKLDSGVKKPKKEPTTSRLVKNLASAQENNYNLMKKPLANKKRSSNMLFSKLDIVTQNHASITKPDSSAKIKKNPDVGSVQMRKQNGYLMNRLSPKSHASIGGGEPYFKFDFLDHSVSIHQGNVTNSTKEKIHESQTGEPQSSSFRRAFASKTTKILPKRDLDKSSSSTSMSNFESHMELIQVKMAQTLARFEDLVETKKAADNDRLAHMESLARENGILKERIKALERRLV